MKNKLNYVILCFSFLILNCEIPAKKLKSEAEFFLIEHPSSKRHALVDGKQVRYIVSGRPENPPLILVHGAPGSWEGWVRYLKDSELNSHFFIIAVDRLGYGESNKGQSEVSLKKQAQAIYEISKVLNLKKVIAVGHSLGGPVVVQLAIDHADMVSGIVLVAASVSPQLEEIKWYQHPATWFGIRQIIPDDLRVCNEEILALKIQLEQMSLEWSQVKSLVAIVHGKKDNLVPVENVDYMLGKLDSKNIVAVEIDLEMNHFVPWTRPDLIKKVVFEINRKLNTKK